VTPADVSAALEILARAFAPVIARAVVDELTAGRTADYVDQASSPLPARTHCRLIREGAIPGMQAGRRWIAKRADVDAYIEARSRRKRAKTDDPSELAAELGIRLVGGTRR
jgi:excisionase family DNA binding protein